ncbi:type II secretion system protein [Acinetobacter sp. ANC 4805]|uniref:type II secretion system protein n=1 Tax=Acinetobacter sp. ANC 4805 TaxID=2923425 RepID=UPI001F4B44D7|nr:type II secretion system protein [Acinetobacter sp. ANC 4805]MCH7311204.1 type II secretion system GspH family protein [Acinetobacter sp. ANC 4805]
MFARMRGFTLVEMLVTLTLISIIASMAFPLIQLDQKRRQERELKDALIQIRTALDNYKQAVDEGRIYMPVDSSGYPKTLTDLVDGVPDLKDIKGRKIYFLRRIPTDPFVPDQANGAESWALRSYASPADAPEAGDDVYDIHSKSKKLALDGTRYDKW